MAEVSQDNTTLNTRTRIEHVRRIFELIADNSLDEIKQIFESLHPEQRITIVNSSIHGSIPFYIAVNHTNIEISRYLLEISLLQGSRKMSARWKTCRHPLFAAIQVGNPQMIELILQNLSDINDHIGAPLSPLMVATCLGDLTAVKLIVARGADVNRSCFEGKIPLMESTFNSEICQYLVSQGANVNHQDDEGLTALHLAVNRDHKQSIILLINVGADVRIRNHEGIPPLMWGIVNQSVSGIMDLIQHGAYSALERVEVFEMLNASLICTRHSGLYACPIMSDIEQWRYTLDMRRMENLPKNCQVPAQEILDLSQEFTTLTELENLEDNPLLFAYQSILIVERVLGKNNRLYLQFLLQTALIAKNVNNLEKSKTFIDYIQEYCQESSVLLVVSNLRFFNSLFCEIGDVGDQNHFFENGGFAIFKIIAQAALKMWSRVKDGVSKNPYLIDDSYSETVDIFLRMVYSITTSDLSQDNLGLFREVVTEVVGMDLRLRLRQSILHRAIKMMEIKSCWLVELITILLESGADANSKDCFRRTPIMYAVKHAPEDIVNDVLGVLLAHGGHTDCRSNEGFTVMDHIDWERVLITPKLRNLRCLAAGAILDNGIPYEEILPKMLVDFVNMHI